MYDAWTAVEVGEACEDPAANALALIELSVGASSATPSFGYRRQQQVQRP